MAKLGEIRRFDSQADIWRTQYRLVEHTGGDLWVAEMLAPEPHVLDEMIEMAAAEETNGHWGMFGTDKVAGVEREWAALLADEGRRFKVRLVSSARYAEMF
jgi:hypothetical protein